MKRNLKLPKKIMLMTSFAASVIGFNSIFNQAQATGNKLPEVCKGSGVICKVSGNLPWDNEKDKDAGAVVIQL